MGVDKHSIAVVVLLGAVLLTILILLFVNQKNIAGKATFTGIEPQPCGGGSGDENTQLCQEESFVCEQGLCVPADKTIDSDHDGLTDYDEVIFYGTNPLGENSDGDDLPDSREVIVYEAGQYVNDNAGLVTQLTHSFKRLFKVD